MAKASAEPDEVLVVAAILGDLGAFDQLVMRYRAAVMRTAQAIVGRDNAEDVAQDAFLLAFKALPSIEEPKRFAAWLSAITRHRAMRFGKQESAHLARRVEMDEVLLAELGALTQPLPEARGTEETMRALANIPEELALVLRLHVLDEMPLKRIAGFLGVPLTTVKWRSQRGRKLLREQMEQLRK